MDYKWVLRFIIWRFWRDKYLFLSGIDLFILKFGRKKKDG